MSATSHHSSASAPDHTGIEESGRSARSRLPRYQTGRHRFCKLVGVFYAAAWLAAGSLDLGILRADDPPAPAKQPDRAGQQAGQEQEKVAPPRKPDSSPGAQPEPGNSPKSTPPSAERATDKPEKSETPLPAPVPKRVKRDDLANAFTKVIPASLADLESIQHHVEGLTAQVSPAVVAVRVGSATGSAVVVSEDGIVLSAAHVCGSPNRDVQFTFPDGKTARGKTLGTNHEIDAGLMKITDPGPWFHAEIGELESARLGDWVLALGHPGGFDRQRPVVARLGRIIRLASGVVQSDCTLIGGDSGGPLFDMHGRVIAIHSRISDSTAANFHVPIGTYHETWDRLAKGESWGDQRLTRWPYVGASGVADPAGCKLDRVDENGPAFRAGLKVGDIVMKVNGQEVKDFISFMGSVRRSRSGEELTLSVKRDNKEMTVKMKLDFRRRGR